MSRQPKWGTGTPAFPAAIAERFHRWYYRDAARTWKRTAWRGIPVQKNPFDLWTLAELIQRLKPSVIIEGGTYAGGSALWMADLCAIAGHGVVMTIDVNAPAVLPNHPRLLFHQGDMLASATVEWATQFALTAGSDRPVMVILDDNHQAEHVLQELRLYSPLVTPGSYLICEDTNLGHEAWRHFGPGPREALAQWMAEDAPPFDPDPECERHGFSFHPGGWLRRRDG